jgi:diguanylate cyclase (GGDEF)-like protein
MESGNLALVLALTLACTGVMFLVIAKQVKGRSGMATFALGLVLFGVVFAVPTQVDLNAGLVVGVLLDSLAVAAVLLLRRGLQRFMQRHELNWTSVGLLLLVFVVAAAGVRLLFGADARPVFLLLVLGVQFGWLSWSAARDAFRDNPLLRTPLAVLSGVLAVLALLSLGQAAFQLQAGAASAGSQAEAIYDAILMLSALLLGPTLLWMHTEQLTQQLVELSTRDPLTRLLNENGLDEVLKRHFSRREHDPVTLMHVDVDQFARVNKLHGEAAGDDVLRMIGLALETSLRSDDFVARVGGEEFVVGCVNNEVGKAAILAERLRAAVAGIQTGLNDKNGHLRCTVSVGLSRPFNSLEQWRAAWHEAEISLQAAKDAGCNCVVHPTVA